MTPTLIIFSLGLFGIVFLYLFKAWEVRHQKRIVSGVRATLDRGALRLSTTAYKGWQTVTHLPRWMTYGIRRAAFLGALLMAAFARLVEDRAHRLARLIARPYRQSSRKKKQVETTTSVFLEEVSAHTGVNADQKSSKEPGS